tara:strand:- start:2508 stop:2666 length:159 start_codon:yes stop_codon:yes gene_type:complete
MINPKQNASKTITCEGGGFFVCPRVDVVSEWTKSRKGRRRRRRSAVIRVRVT